jgi:hypothetical protein
MNKTLISSLAAIPLATAGAFSLAGSASAAQINGGISFIGGFKPVDSSWKPTTLDVATGINFKGDAMRAGDCNGDFATYISCDPLFGDVGTITDFQFAPFTTTIPNFWSIGGFAFELEGIAVDTQTTSQLALTGSGTITGNGFDATDGTWVFTGNQQGGTLTWSSSSASTPVESVPEPATLLGLGLVGAALAGISRRQKTVKS